MPDPSARPRPCRCPMQLPFLYGADEGSPDQLGVGWMRNVGEGGACAELTESLQPPRSFPVRLNSPPV